MFRDPLGGHCDCCSGHTVDTALWLWTPPGPNSKTGSAPRPSAGGDPGLTPAAGPPGWCAQSALADLVRSPQGPRVSHTLLLSHPETSPQPPPLKFITDTTRSTVNVVIVSGTSLGTRQVSLARCCVLQEQALGGMGTLLPGRGMAPTADGDVVLRPGPHPGRMLTHGT